MNGRTASWIMTCVVPDFSSAFSPASTDSCRVASAVDNSDGRLVASHVAKRLLEQGFVIGVNDDDDRVFPRPCRKNIKGMGDNRPSANGAILLGAVLSRTGAFAAPRSDDDDTTGKLFFCVHYLYGFPRMLHRLGPMPLPGAASMRRSHRQTRIGHFGARHFKRRGDLP